ncbi:MAG: MFS transporter [Pirellulales bacterium]|nr:MFS transporter [Pirellulales bacterium]
MSRLAVSSASAAIDLERPLDRGGRVLNGAVTPLEIAKPQAAVASSRLFYGWVMVPLAMAVMIASAPGQTYGFMSFNRSLRESLSLSQTEFSGIYLLATLCAAAPLSYLGRLTDRFGLKRSLLVSIAAMAGVCFLASTAQNSMMLLAACFGLRMIGAGLMSLLATNTLAAWFDRRLGLACGIMQFGGAASVAIVPICLLYAIDGVGWRGTFAVIGVGLLAALWPLIAMFYRERPNDVGQHLDGDARPPVWSEAVVTGRMGTTAPLRVVDEAHPPSLDLQDALRTRVFWLLLVSTAVWSLIATGLMFHVESLLTACQLTMAETAWATPLMAVSMAAVLLGGGLLVDRISIRILLTAALLCVAAGCIVLANVSGVLALAAYGVYGVGQGLMTVVGSASWAKFFGPAHLGHIRGTAMTVGIACSALGPLVMGASVDYLGGFEPSLWLFTAVATFVAAVGAVAGGGEVAAGTVVE